MNKIIKINKFNKFRYKNIKCKIEYLENNVYIILNNKIFKF